MNAQNLQSSVESAGQLELFVKDCDHQVGADRNPDLGLHRVGARAIVMLDSQVALDPSKEQLDAPAQLVEHGNRQSRNFQVVGQEDQLFAGFHIVVSDFPKEDGKRLPRFGESRFSNMVAAQAGKPVHRLREMPRELEIGFCTGDKESSGLGNQRQTREVHVAAIHEIKSSSFEKEAVEPSHVVLSRPSNVDASRNWATQVDLCVHLDARLGLTKVRPRKQSKRQVDRRGIQRVDRIVQIDTEILARIKRPGFAHQTFGQILPNPPVPVFVGIRESRFGNRFCETKMIKCVGLGVEAGSDVAQSVPGSHLRENHASELLAASEMSNGERGLVPLYDAVECLAMNQIENLGDNEAAGVHGRKFLKRPSRSSNPSHAFLNLIDSFLVNYKDFKSN